MISTRKKFVLQTGVMAAAIFFGSTTNAAELKQADTEKNASKEIAEGRKAHSSWVC